MPLNNPSKSGAAASGNYTGNDSVNRAIPHGLPGTPKAVIVVYASGAGAYGDYVGIIKAGVAVTNWLAGGANSRLAVTAMDATNFYVGNATSYTNSLNDNSVVFHWVAIP